AAGTEGEAEVSDGKQFGYDWAELTDIAGKSLGRVVRLVLLPRAVSSPVARAVDWVARMQGKSGMLNPDKIAEMYHPDWVTKGPGLPLASPIAFARGFPETLEWYRQAGWLPQDRATARSSAKTNREAGE